MVGFGLFALLLLPVRTASAQSLPSLTKAKPQGAQAAPAPAKPAPVEATAEAPDSPRASGRAFVKLAAIKGDFVSAARYLMLGATDRGRGPELARRIRAVMERHLDIDIDALSPLSEGAAGDGLPAGVDKIGVVPDGVGGQDPVFFVRAQDAQGSYWAFSYETVDRIDGWYDALPDRWIRDRIPERLQRYGPAGLMWWQWIALPIFAVIALALGRILGHLTRTLLARATQRTQTPWDERWVARVGPTLTLLWAVVAAAVLLSWLALLPSTARIMRSVLGGIATIAVVSALWRTVDLWAEYVVTRPGVADNPSAQSLVSLLRNGAKVVVGLGGFLATLAAFGYPVTTALAGLGIGGIALAFGAQKTIENLFGSVSLAVDQPFRVGDFVTVENFSGQVERIGMRSTQIRTLDRTLVSIPNGMLADMRIEDFASRDRIRFACTIGLVYGTTRVQIERIIDGLERVLRGHALIWPDTVVVRFAEFGASALQIEVMAWFLTSDIAVFRDCRQEALFGFMQVIEDAGSSLAFPTQTIRFVSDTADAAQLPFRTAT